MTGENPGTATPPAATRRRLRIAGLAVFSVCLAAYLASSRPASLVHGWDTLGTRVVPFALLRDHRVTLDSFAAEFSRDPRPIGYLENRRGHLVSHYPIGPAIVALPLDAPLYAALRILGKTSPRDVFSAAEKAAGPSASVIAALSVVVLFFLLSESAGLGVAACVSLAFGLGTSMWAIASRELWEHGPDALFLLLGYRFLSRPRFRPRDVALAGACLGLLFGIRPAAGIFAAAGFAAAVWREPGIRKRARAAAAFAAGAAVAAAPFVFYDVFFFHKLMGGSDRAAGHLSLEYLPAGFLGLSFSPNRGLFVYTPVAIVGIVGAAIAFRQWRDRRLLCVFLATGILYSAVHFSFQRWAGGWSFGPRYLIECLPLLALASPLALRRMSPPWIAASVYLGLASVAVQLVGVSCEGASTWETRMGLPLEAHAWDWRHIELWEDFTVCVGMRGREILPPQGFRVRWESASVPSVLGAGRPALVDVRLRNASHFSWPDPKSANLGGDPGRHAVRLSDRWLAAGPGAPLTEYTERADLDAPLRPGESASLSIVVVPPAEPGEYRLQFDLIQEGVGSFEAAGAQRLIVPVRVR